MRTWENPTLSVLSINATEHSLTGIYRDGGYIGDGIISGHLSWSKPEEATQPTQPIQPTNPSEDPAEKLS